MGFAILVSFDESNYKIELKKKKLLEKLRNETGIPDIRFKPAYPGYFLYMGEHHSEIWETFHDKNPTANDEAMKTGASHVGDNMSPEMNLADLVDWIEKWVDKIIEAAKEVVGNG